MSNVVFALKDLEDFFQGLTMEMLGLDPLLKVNQGKVRIAWATSGAPSWKITEDVVFLQVTDIDDSITQQRDNNYSSLNSDGDIKMKTTYTQVHNIQWTIYGPNSYENANAIKDYLYLPHFMELMMNKKLSFILNLSVPKRVPELFNGQWWSRVDFNANFNELVNKETVIHIIKSENVVVIPSR